MSFEVNKILGALLSAAIFAIVAGLISHAVVPADKLAKNAYPIEAKEAAPAAEASAEPDKPVPVTAADWIKADPAKGETIAAKCGQCHNWEKGSGTKVGPSLYGVVGRPKASMAGFSYSDALKKMGGNWTPEAMADFIYKPALAAPGTKMTFAGLTKPEDRADVIAFLDKQSDAPVDLPK